MNKLSVDRFWLFRLLRYKFLLIEPLVSEVMRDWTI